MRTSGVLEHWTPKRISPAARDRPVEREELAAQELRVALQLARGLASYELAQALFLSPKTMELHPTRIDRSSPCMRAPVERFADQVS